jgi:hypothetical protein
MSLDSFGQFLESSLNIKTAEIQFPANNITIYQEDNNSEGSRDLLEYAEPWGGAQNRPFKDMSNPNSLEQDPTITRQGERPEMFNNIVIPPEEAPVSTNMLPETGIRYPSGDLIPSNLQSGFPEDRNSIPPVLGEPNDIYDTADSPNDRVYVYASEKGAGMNKKLVDKTVKLAYTKGFQKGANEPHKIKVAFLEDLYGFDTTADANSLIHKSSRELWSIAADGDGFVIEKQFDGNGTPVKV